MTCVSGLRKLSGSICSLVMSNHCSAGWKSCSPRPVPQVQKRRGCWLRPSERGSFLHCRTCSRISCGCPTSLSFSKDAEGDRNSRSPQLERLSLQWKELQSPQCSSCLCLPRDTTFSWFIFCLFLYFLFFLTPPLLEGPRICAQSYKHCLPGGFHPVPSL